MGWCSGTQVFDRVCRDVLNSRMSDEHKLTVTKALIDGLEDHDWDCQDDSDYRNNPIVIMALKQLHPDWDWEDNQ